MSNTRPILILGMHRSGTSCLTGCLQEAGLFLGDVNVAAPANKKGNRENLSIMTLHDQVLGKAGAAWDDPPLRPLTWQDSDLLKLTNIIKSFENQALWGTKDPRALFTYLGWEALCRPQYVGTFRHPMEVVSSLVRRSVVWGTPMSETKAIELWSGYNTQLLHCVETKEMPLLRYDIPTDIYNKKLRQIAKYLGLNEMYQQSFRDPELYNEAYNALPIPKECQAIWEGLLEYAL